MLQTSEDFKAAIVGSPRYIQLYALVDISDPDRKIFPVESSGEAPWSKSEQLYNYELDPPDRYVTLEPGRAVLDKTFDLYPDSYDVPGEVGFASDTLSGPGGLFPRPQPWITMRFSGVRILQAVSLFFSSDPADGVPRDFTVEVMVGDQVFHREEVVGNSKAELAVKGFTVHTPDTVRLTVSRWSLPGRRLRMVEFVIGYLERWGPDMLASFTATLQGSFDALSLPYGSVTLAMDNADRRFEPRRKDSLFQSIEERQGIELFIGCKLSRGIEKVRLGIFYQAGDGWKTSANELTMRWYLVDIIGLIANRTFIVPEELPTTLEGWIRALAAQLGEAFEPRYHVDPAYANKPVTANSREDVTGKKCGDILRWACQATGTWPRARQEDGALTAEPLWNQGSKITLDNLNTYPTMKANRSLAVLIFQLADGEGTEYSVSGNSTNSEETVTIINPFIHTPAQALEAARLILSQYGGNQIELTGRGNPSCEIGDVDTVWLDESNAAAARRMMQTFQFQGGVMRDCRSTLLQADGSYLWEEFAIMEEEDGTFTAPEGVTDFRLVLSDGGQGGSRGHDGYVHGSGLLPGQGVASGYGDPGLDGNGGRVWFGTIKLNPGERVRYHRGRGGAASDTAGVPGAEGEHSTFGAYSSANGGLYPGGYTDIANGNTFCRTGVEKPLPGTGDGGKGGRGGDPGEGYWQQLFWPDGRPRGWDFIVTEPPGPGHPGVAGASGFIMITWQKPEKK